MRFFTLAIVFSLGVAAQPAAAGVLDLRAYQLDLGGVSDPWLTRNGGVVNDLRLDFSGQLGGQQLALVLTSGSILQHPLGRDTAPSDALIEAFPSVAYDSFVTVGGLTADTSRDVLMVGNATNINGSEGRGFGATTLSQTFAAAPGTFVNSGTDFSLGRLTLSPDAVGELVYFGSAFKPWSPGNPDDASFFRMPIAGGVIGAAERPQQLIPSTSAWWGENGARVEQEQAERLAAQERDRLAQAERLAAEQAAAAELARQEAEAARVAAEREAWLEQHRAEQERIATEAAARLAAEHAALVEETTRLERERLAAEEAAWLELRRLEQEQAAQQNPTDITETELPTPTEPTPIDTPVVTVPTLPVEPTPDTPAVETPIEPTHTPIDVPVATLPIDPLPETTFGITPIEDTLIDRVWDEDFPVFTIFPHPVVDDVLWFDPTDLVDSEDGRTTYLRVGDRLVFVYSTMDTTMTAYLMNATPSVGAAASLRGAAGERAVPEPTALALVALATLATRRAA